MKTKFDFYDYFIFFFILLVSIGIGLFFGFNLNEKLKSFVRSLFNKSKAKVGATSAHELEDQQDQLESKKKQLEQDGQGETEESKEKEEENKTMEYLTANKSMSALPIALSILATFFSSSSLLGFPAEVYLYGIQYWLIVFGVCLVPLIGAFATGPFFQSLEIVSIFEYLKMRYDSEAARLLGVTLYMIRTFIAMGIVIFGPATALSSLTDLSDATAILMIGLIATFYTTIGGIKAVIWTDAFQAFIMFSGVIAVIAKGTHDVGGFSNLFDINYYGERLNFFDFDPNPLVRQSFWSLVIGGTVAWSMSYAIDQQMMQRFSAAKTQKTAQLALLLNIPGIFMLITLCCFTGLVLYANFSTCDPLNPLSETGVKNPNQLLPYFVMLKFNNIIFIPGLFLSSIFCASLSSVSSALNSMSACIWRDYLMRFERFKKADTKHSSRTTKLIALLCGLGCTGMGFLIGLSDSNLIQISSTINGALQAPIIGIFFVSSLFPMTNIYGLFAGALSGFGMGFWIGLGSFIAKPNYPKLPLTADGCPSVLANSTSLMLARNTATNLEGFDKIYSLSYMWLSPLGVLTVIIVGLAVSFVTNFFVEKRVIDDSLILYKYKAALKARENKL